MHKVIIDVREPEEYAKSHYDGAINIPVNQIKAKIDQQNIPKDAEIVTYCNFGGRAGRARDTLQELGYQNVINGINQSSVESKYSHN